MMLLLLIAFGALIGMFVYAVLASNKSVDDSTRAMARQELAAAKLAQHLRQQRSKSKKQHIQEEAARRAPSQTPSVADTTKVPAEKLRHRSRLQQRKVDKDGQIS